MPKDRHFDEIIRALKRRYREEAASERSTPWRVVLFTMLTARSRDAQVEPVFRDIMRKWPSPAKLAEAKVGEVEQTIRTIGFYKNKARMAVDLAKAVVRDHGGKVPRTMDELVELPGVGRKTASCTLVYAFGIPAIAVDTHVHRIVNRLGWVKSDAPEKTEKRLREILPDRHWMDINRVMVQFGRDICVPGTPKCWKCPVREWCGFTNKTPKPDQKTRRHGSEETRTPASTPPQ